MKRTTSRESRRGSVMMEAVIAMPILLFLIFVIIQFAHVWTAKQMVSYAAFCAARAALVAPPSEQLGAAQNAARVALSWMCFADRGESGVVVPGWGKVNGSGSVQARVIMEPRDLICNGTSASDQVVAVRVRFRFPLLISGMAANKVLATFAAGSGATASSGGFIENLAAAAQDTDTSIDGFWPWIELTDTCVLPMPYSTGLFPAGAFSGAALN